MKDPNFVQHTNPSKRMSARMKHRIAVAKKKADAEYKFRVKNLWTKAVGLAGPAKERKRTEHIYKQKDEHGAITMTGRNTPVRASEPWRENHVIGWVPGRRIWVAGVSAHQIN